MLKQHSLSPLYHNEEDYLNPKKPQQTSQLPQFSKYYKENIQQPQLMQTVRKKPLIFDNRQYVQFNVSPMRMGQVQFKVSQPRSPMIRRTMEIQNLPNPQVMLFQVNNSQTPQKKQSNNGQFQLPIQQVQRPTVQYSQTEQFNKTNLTEMQQSKESRVQSRQSESTNTIYLCLQDELAKSEMKLKILTERSQQIQEQRMQLRNAYKNQKPTQKQ